jgi:ubiquinone/menaquinone biosynthesis C-methylase UbiE
VTNTFQGLHAAHYDLIYAEKRYDDEARFVADLLPSDGSLLDIACGTGRHALEFAGMGYEVTGVDYNESLLERARESASSAGREIEFVAADMRELELGRTFDAVTCLFDSIGYPATNDGVVAALASAARHLTPEGTFAVEFLHAPAMLAGASPVRVRRWELPGGGRLLRVSETRLDVARGLMTVAYELLELEPGGAGYRSASEEQTNRFFSLEEMRALMSTAGLEVRRFLPAYEDGEAIDESTFHVIAVAGHSGR